MRCRGSTPGSFERPSQRALSRQIAHSGGAASSARSAQPRARQPKMVTQQRIQALSSERPAGSRGGNPHRDMGRRPGRRPVGGPAPGRLPYARTRGARERAHRARPSPHPKASLTRARKPSSRAAGQPWRHGRPSRPQGRGELRGRPPPTRTRRRTSTHRTPRLPGPCPGHTTARGKAPGSRTSGHAAHHEGRLEATRPPAAGGVSAARPERSRARRHRCRSGAGGRCGSPAP